VRLVEVAEPGHTVSIGGHALAADEPLHATTGRDHVLVRRPDGLASALFVLRQPAGAPALHAHRARGANAFGTHSTTPVYEAPGPLHAVAVLLGAIPAGDAPPPAPRAELTPRAATVWWPDGSRDTVTW
jgi:hypothetical protein